MTPKNATQPFRSAKAELKEQVKPPAIKTRAEAYKLAFLDQGFLLRKALRPVRLQLELLKPELMQQDEHIESTVVIFGSARIPEPVVSKRLLNIARRAVKASPDDPQLQKKVKIAENVLKNSYYYEQARQLGYIISHASQKGKKLHYVIVTGGGPGIMEGANRGAFDANAKSIAHNILLPNEQAPNPYISPELCFQFHYFAIRKMHFLIRARAAVFFPGGYGTLDELFETLTLLQTSKIEPLPILLFGREYWENLVNFDFLVEQGMILEEDLALFKFVETAEEAWKIIQSFYRTTKK